MRISKVAAVAAAAVTSGAAVVGLTTGVASAQPQCPDVHWIGAAGSGERAGDLTADGGMGRVIHKSYRDFAQLVARDGRTVTGEAVQYPATAVPEDGGILDWANFMSSVDTGAEALGQQYATFVAQCPTSQVVLAGYSQGAMVVHRNLHALDASPNLAAALLIADGDRLPQDPTINLGSVTSVPGAGKGVAQDWPILAHAPAPLPVTMGSRTISVCDLGDAVCDYDPDAEDEMNPAAVAVHTSYARSATDSWTLPLYQIVDAAPESVVPVGPPAGQIVASAGS
ncbi:cutinase family protein [Mycolicibacterium poriferae]|uniref:cutinase family protein n=1 Tax=Mycolicibacterium poriferae TaxID=39694 RepID=UPI0024B9CCE6|nr:cutinase family protein [Mycolicibacterium poriferae]